MSDLNTTRRQPHEVVTHLSVVKPQVMFRAQVNSSTITKNARTIPYDNYGFDIYTTIQNGYTLYVGTTSGGKDLGRVRVKSADATNIYVAENSHIAWADNVYITVVRFREPWGVYPVIILDPSNNPVFYKDTDIAYTDQNSKMDPVVCMGANRALFTHGEELWTSSGSYSPVGASLTSYSWSFDGGVPRTSTQAHPGAVNYPVAGTYEESLTIGDSNGKSFTGYRYVVVTERPVGTFSKWKPTSLEADRDSGTYKLSFEAHEDVSNASILVDGALVILWAEVRYGGTNNPPVREIKFEGYIADESIKYNAFTSTVSFDAYSITGVMNRRDTFSLALDSKAHPKNWTQMPDITPDKAMVHYLRWQSTVMALADFFPTGDTRLIQYADFARGPLFSAVQQFLSSTLLGELCCNRKGQIFAEIDLNMQNTGTPRDVGSWMDLARRDWMNEPSIKRVQSPDTSYTELGGVAYYGDADGGFGAWLSGAPGDSPAYFGAAKSITGLAINNQSDLNILSGLYWADLASEFPEVVFELAGNYTVLDIAPQKWVYTSLAAGDTWAGLVWNAKRLIPRRISWTINSEDSWARPEVTFKQETYAPPGDTIVIPVDAPYDPGTTFDQPPDQPIPSVPSITPGDGNAMFGLRGNFVIRTFNFLDLPANVVWADITGAITGTPIVFRLDPWDPANKATVMTTDGIWYSTNIRSVVPTWTKSFSTAQLQAKTSGSMSFHSACKMKMNITASGYISILVMEVANNAHAFYVVGSDYTNAATYTGHDIGTVVTYNGQAYDAGLATSEHTKEHVWVSTGLIGAGLNTRAWHSTDGGVNWTAVTLNAPAFGSGQSGGAYLFIPYTGNDTDLIVYAYYCRRGNPAQNVLQVTIDGGLNWTTVANSTSLYRPISEEALTESPFETVGFNAYYFASGGQPNPGILYQLTLYPTPALTQLYGNGAPSSHDEHIGGFGGWPYSTQILRMYDSFFAQVQHSNDGGLTWVSSHGNLDSIAPTGVVTYLVPIWVAY